MERHNRDNYGWYDGYDRDDRNYHGARNLTNEFEQEYQHERGYRDPYSYNRELSYHEGGMGNAYERERRDYDRHSNYGRAERGRRYPENYNDVRNRYSNYQDDYRSYTGADRGARNYRSENDERYNSYNRYSGTRHDYHHVPDNDARSRFEGTGHYQRNEDNWYASGHRRDELNRYY